MNDRTHFKRKLAEGKRAAGAFLVLPDEVVAEVAAGAGFDYLVVDCQHGLFGYDTMRRMITAAEPGDAAILVRVPPGDDYAVGRALDAGADGMIVPLVNEAADVEKAVAAAAYGPEGTRSFGPMRALIRDGSACFRASRGAAVILPQIETVAALENLDAIVAVPGIDGVYVGPMDLAIALGLDPSMDSDAPVFVEALERIVSACGSAGIAAAIHADAVLAAKRFEQGFTAVTVATDIAVVSAGFGAALDAAKRTPAGSAAGERTY